VGGNKKKMIAPEVKGFYPMLQYIITGKDTLNTFKNKESALEYFKKFKVHKTVGRYGYKFVKAKKYTHFIIYAERPKRS